MLENPTRPVGVGAKFQAVSGFTKTVIALGEAIESASSKVQDLVNNGGIHKDGTPDEGIKSLSDDETKELSRIKALHQLFQNRAEDLEKLIK
jgi:hypothetical protein